MLTLNILRASQPDSLKINVEYSQIIKANKLLTELEGLRLVVDLQEDMIHTKGAEAAFYHIALNHCLSANDTLHNVILPRYDEILHNRETVLKKANKELKHYKGEALGLKIATPVVGVFIGVGAFLLGWYLH